MSGYPRGHGARGIEPRVGLVRIEFGVLHDLTRERPFDMLGQAAVAVGANHQIHVRRLLQQIAA